MLEIRGDLDLCLDAVDAADRTEIGSGTLSAMRRLWRRAIPPSPVRRSTVARSEKASAKRVSREHPTALLTNGG
jgi:hypothetical protein